MIREFVEHLGRNRGYRPGTCREYEKDLTAFVTWVQDETDIRRWRDVTKATIDQYVADLNGDGLAPATIKRRVSTLRSLYTYARGRGLIDHNPAQWVSTPKLGKHLPTVADAAQITATLQDLGISRETKLAVAILAETGIRISELCNITRDDIDMQAKSIRIRGKGNKDRYVYYGNRTESLLTGFGYGWQYIIKGSVRETRHAVYTATGASPHSIRHLYATTMLNNGADLKTIAMLLGHESVKTTEIYARMGTARAKATYEHYKPTY